MGAGSGLSCCTTVCVSGAFTGAVLGIGMYQQNSLEILADELQTVLLS